MKISMFGFLWLPIDNCLSPKFPSKCCIQDCTSIPIRNDCLQNKRTSCVWTCLRIHSLQTSSCTRKKLPVWTLTQSYRCTMYDTLSAWRKAWTDSPGICASSHPGTHISEHSVHINVRIYFFNRQNADIVSMLSRRSANHEPKIPTLLNPLMVPRLFLTPWNCLY